MQNENRQQTRFVSNGPQALLAIGNRRYPCQVINESAGGVQLFCRKFSTRHQGRHGRLKVSGTEYPVLPIWVENRDGGFYIGLRREPSPVRRTGDRAYQQGSSRYLLAIVFAVALMGGIAAQPPSQARDHVMTFIQNHRFTQTEPLQSWLAKPMREKPGDVDELAGTAIALE